MTDIVTTSMPLILKAWSVPESVVIMVPNPEDDPHAEYMANMEMRSAELGYRLEKRL